MKKTPLSHNEQRSFSKKIILVCKYIYLELFISFFTFRTKEIETLNISVIRFCVKVPSRSNSLMPLVFSTSALALIFTFQLPLFPLPSSFL